MKMKIRKSDDVLSVMSKVLIDLPSPTSISYFWNFGSLLGMFLVIQIVTGLFLALHFSGDVMVSFNSVIHLMRDVNMGWIIRVIHSNGASLFFFCLYFHMGRGMYYGSYRMGNVWMSGITIFLLIMATAFLGYVLPWGQMSFWAATVITNLLSAIPYIGVMLVEWVWGGFAVGNPTLTRFFAFHFVLPFVVMFFVVLHLMFLHKYGSSNPLGLDSDVDSVSFHVLFVSKDIVGFLVLIIFLVNISLFWPYVFMDSENFISSNPMITPVHIQPEWYFLFAYCILRSISSKIGGVVALLISVTVFYLFPFVYKCKLNLVSYYFLSKVNFWVIVVNWLMLTWLGSCVVESPYTEMGSVFSFMYFFLFLVNFISMKFQDYVI